MEVKQAVMRVDVSRETGEVMLFVETACGFKPVMGWPNKEVMREFAARLFCIGSRINDEIKEDIFEIS